MKSLITLLFICYSLSINCQYNLCSENGVLVGVSHNSEQGVTYQWSSNGGEIIGDEILFNSVGVYTIELTAFLNGCESIDKAIIRIDTCEEWTFYAPNSFAPDGVNKMWSVKGWNIVVKNVLIFNRWGLLVWDSVEAWDGIGMSGNVCEGVHVWQCWFDTPKGLKMEQGSVTVVR
jgi:hypothetical protein